MGAGCVGLREGGCALRVEGGGWAEEEMSGRGFHAGRGLLVDVKRVYLSIGSGQCVVRD